MRNRTVLALVTAITLVGGSVFYYLSENPRLRVVLAQITARPFLIERSISVPDESGALKLWRVDVIARRSDGATAKITSLGPISLRKFTRKLTFPDGRTLTLFDHIKVRTTWPTMSDEELTAYQSHITYPPADCGANSRNTHLLRSEMIGGQSTFVLQTLVPGKYRVTRWVAPALDCEELQSEAEMVAEDGSYKVSAETKLSRVLVGEPDSRLFDVGSGFEELSPSSAGRRWRADLTAPITPEELKRLEAEEKYADRRYRKQSAK